MPEESTESITKESTESTLESTDEESVTKESTESTESTKGSTDTESMTKFPLSARSPLGLAW
jgi:hypothetical protein